MWLLPRIGTLSGVISGWQRGELKSDFLPAWPASTAYFFCYLRAKPPKRDVVPWLKTDSEFLSSPATSNRQLTVLKAFINIICQQFLSKNNTDQTVYSRDII